MIAALLPLLLPTVAGAAKVKIPKDAPYCAATGTRPTFVSPMGEPFRAAPGQPYPAAAWFAAADRDGDGAIGEAEMVRDAARFFATLDRNHDARLTPDEVTAYEHEVAPEIAIYASDRLAFARRPGRRRAGESGYGGPSGAGRYAWLNVPEPVSAADADIDRVVTADEFNAAAARRFDALDGRQSGRLRLSDLPRTPQQVQMEGPCWPRPTAPLAEPGRERDQPR
ncbi:EF-hand domain-containing protein [uncultured Sphingomonas sp.]|uniref:EF-hand domain-containing protein n=1 Tax=uncultured Sphingomonas sp. TaxID=158754 RepID=UPI0025EA88AE|nr:EF-hand domain-containing protein [uncultured Sphingomonas sp.]